MYISKSTNGGKTWTQVVRVGADYFDADIGEGERNGLSVSPGGREFVITTQLGAFQVLPQTGAVRAIMGPRISHPDPMVTIAKKEGDPVTANVVKMTADGKHLIVGYGILSKAADPDIPQRPRWRMDAGWAAPRFAHGSGSSLHGVWRTVSLRGHRRSGFPPENRGEGMDAH